MIVPLLDVAADGIPAVLLTSATVRDARHNTRRGEREKACNKLILNETLKGVRIC